MLASVFQFGLHLEQTLARIHHLHQLLAFRVVGLIGSLAEGLGKPSDYLRIDAIVLGQSSSRTGEVAHPLRVDDPDFDISFAQRLAPVAFVAATGLHYRLAHLVASQPGNQLASSLRSARKRLPLR